MFLNRYTGNVQLKDELFAILDEEKRSVDENIVTDKGKKLKREISFYN